MKTILRYALVLGAILTPGALHAQYPGDVFFSKTSIDIAAGQTATVEPQAFTGASVFGASHVEITYDPAAVEVSAAQGSTAAVQVYARPGSTTLSLVSLNTGSLTAPIGTIGLASLTLRPLGRAGTTTRLTIAVRKMLKQGDSSAFPAGSGGSLTVNVR